MKTIYIDSLICVNLFIDYLILIIIKTSLHINARGRRVLLGALLGSISTLSVLFPIRSIFIESLYKIGCSIFIIMVAFGKTSFKNFTIRMLTFLGINMLLSTAVITINLLWKPTGVFIYNNTLYFDVSPKILIIATAVIYLLLSIYNRLSSTHTLRCSIHRITLTANNKTITFESAVDTGCNLKEPFSGLPVILAEKEILGDLSIPDDKLRLIPYTTAAGNTSVLGFKPINLYIDGKEVYRSCYIGMFSGKLKGEIKSIMGPELVEAI